MTRSCRETFISAITRPVALFCAAVVVLTACGESDPTPTQIPPAAEEAVPEATATSLPRPTASPTATATGTLPTVTLFAPSPTPSPTESPSDELSLGELLKVVTPSVVSIRRFGGIGGTGFLVEGNYVVTAAHVVWPHTVIDVVFEDGTEHTDVAVAAFDHFADLAFLGPIDTSAPHLQLGNAKAENEGNTMYSVGHAQGSKELFATEGEFLRLENWTDAFISEVTTSAEGIGGMSGGPVANGGGDVIGVNLRSEESVNIGASSTTVSERLDKMLRGEDASPFGSRFPSTDGGSKEHGIVLRGRWDTAVFWGKHSAASIEFDAPWDIEYGLFNRWGSASFNSTFRSTRQGVGDTCCPGGPWLVVVNQPFDLTREVKLISTTPVARYHDPDDGKQIGIGHSVAGIFDTALDTDPYTIFLNEGDGIKLELTLGLSDATVTIDHNDAAPYEVFVAEGGWQDTHEFEFRAPRNAKYTIAVQRHPGKRFYPSGYVLEISKSTAGDGLSTSSEVQERLDSSFESPFGEMVRHTYSDSNPAIRIDHPLNITGGDRDVFAAELFEQDRWGRTVTLEKRGLSYHREDPKEELSVGDYMERSVLARAFPYKEEKLVTASKEIETPTGGPILIEEFEVNDGWMKGVRLAYIHEDDTGYMAVFYAPSEVFDEWKPVVDYCIGSFSIGGFSVADKLSGG